MKILFSPCHYIFNEKSEGSESSWAYTIADKIASRNKGSVVITGSKQINTDKPYTIIEVQGNKRSIDLSVSNAFRFNILYSLATIRQLRKKRFDILHHVLPFAIGNTFNLAILFGAYKKRPVVIGPVQSLLTYRDNDIDFKNIRSTTANSQVRYISTVLQNILQPILYTLSFLTLAKADKIVVINKHTKKILISKGISQDKICIIPPGIDAHNSKGVQTKFKDLNTIEIITVGYLMKRKSVDLIIQVIAEVVKKHKNVTLRILGDGPQRENLEVLVRNLKLEKYVIFEGSVMHSDIGSYYQRAHIYISMSKSEGFATVCLEAMSYGLAIVSTKVGGFMDAIEDGKNGYLINVDDVQLASQRIITLIKDKNKIIEFGKVSVKKVEKYYDWEEAVIPQYLLIYQNLLNHL